ncbi:hypothetical protein Hanom_Chr13g01237541 [Helianthus anomalus]
MLSLKKGLQDHFLKQMWTTDFKGLLPSSSLLIQNKTNLITLAIQHTSISTSISVDLHLHLRHIDLHLHPAAHRSPLYHRRSPSSSPTHRSPPPSTDTSISTSITVDLHLHLRRSPHLHRSPSSSPTKPSSPPSGDILPNYLCKMACNEQMVA